MQPYTLESYQSGKKAITRSGIVPDEIHYFASIGCMPFRAAIEGTIWSMNRDGRCGSELDHIMDLFEQEEPLEVYMNVYKDYFGHMHSSIGGCKNNVSKGLREIVKLTYNPNKDGDDRFSIEVVKDSLA